jgi:hypothetical protein
MRASARQFKGATEEIRIVNISTDGCGFESRWPFVEGTLVWLALPGLESWAATVIWFREGKGGLQYSRPLHPAVAARYAIAIASGENICPLTR